MTQSILIQVGQCGNQIGCRFWDLCLREHAFHNEKGIYDDAISSFFRNTEYHGDESVDVSLGDGPKKIRKLKARAILVDMEEGVINELLQGQLGEIFDSKQLITNVYGSGNNWAVGNKDYGVKYREEISEQVRKAAEVCDCLQCFFILHSTGGGTGSGLGTSILSILQDDYPDVYRFVCAVYPSKEDDVITSPYNSVLATYELTEKADCVLPINNQSLINICNKVQQATKVNAHPVNQTKKSDKPFDSMNNLVANVILNMTSSSRFEGSLNVDLNEIAMNLVPYPKLHYLTSSISPLYISKDVALPPRKLNQAFDDLFAKLADVRNIWELLQHTSLIPRDYYPRAQTAQQLALALSHQDYQLMMADPRHSLYLACALIARGKTVHTSDIYKNITRLSRNLSFVSWNQEGWKTGLCNVPPMGQQYSLLALANNTCIRHSFTELRDRYVKLYSRKAHMHHYTNVDGFDSSLFQESLTSLDDLIAQYCEIERSSGTGEIQSMEPFQCL